MSETQVLHRLERIEKKLDEVLEFRDLVIKLAMPKIPAAARETALKAMAALRGGG